MNHPPLQHTERFHPAVQPKTPPHCWRLGLVPVSSDQLKSSGHWTLKQSAAGLKLLLTLHSASEGWMAQGWRQSSAWTLLASKLGKALVMHRFSFWHNQSVNVHKATTLASKLGRACVMLRFSFWHKQSVVAAQGYYSSIATCAKPLSCSGLGLTQSIICCAQDYCFVVLACNSWQSPAIIITGRTLLGHSNQHQICKQHDSCSTGGIPSALQDTICTLE